MNYKTSRKNFCSFLLRSVKEPVKHKAFVEANKLFYAFAKVQYKNCFMFIAFMKPTNFFDVAEKAIKLNMFLVLFQNVRTLFFI